MFVNERASQIIEYLKVHKKATIGELSKELFASESTVRRDLTEMQEAGLVARYHGGAILLEGVGEVSIFARAERDAQSKNICADIAIKRLSPFAAYNTVFIDNSSTCLAAAKKLDFSNKTVVTNGLQVALALSQTPDIQLIVPGGSVSASTGAIIGSLTVRTLDSFNFDLMLSSCAGIDDVSANEFSLESAQLKNVVLEKSRYKMLIVGKSKFETHAAHRVAALSAYDCIVTDAPDGQIEVYRKNGVNMVNS